MKGRRQLDLKIVRVTVTQTEHGATHARNAFTPRRVPFRSKCPIARGHGGKLEDSIVTRYEWILRFRQSNFASPDGKDLPGGCATEENTRVSAGNVRLQFDDGFDGGFAVRTQHYTANAIDGHRLKADLIAGQLGAGTNDDPLRLRRVYCGWIVGRNNFSAGSLVSGRGLGCFRPGQQRIRTG